MRVPELENSIQTCPNETADDQERSLAKKPYVAEEDNRLRVLYLYQMLQKYTDEEHSLSGPEIQRMMEEQHGIKIHRTTLPRDIEVLRSAGIEVMVDRHKAKHYYLSERTFSIPELRLLIDAVQSSKFITEGKSQVLIEKLISMTSDTNAAKLRRTVHVTGKAKSDNEKGYYIVDVINEAINSNKKISFEYFDYDTKKKHVIKNNGRPYTVSPYDLIWDGDYYYMTGFCDERGEVRTFRVDRIEKQPELLDVFAVKPPKTYRVEKYTQEVFRMYRTQKTTTVTLRCNVAMMKAVIDKFGTKVRTRALSEDEFLATVKVCTSPTFYRWVFGGGGLMTIDGPEEVKEEFKKLLQEEIGHY